MIKRVKKPTVKPEQRQDWLERHERGESVPHIADVDEFDVRTVRKHIELAKQQREAREARSAVLRNALELHYADLSSFAERLNSRIEGRGNYQTSTNDDYLQSALKQHLPRSPLWVYLNKHERLHNEIAELKEQIKSRVELEVAADTPLKSILSPDEQGVILGINAVLIFQADHWSQGHQGLNISDSLISKPTGDKDYVSLRYGFSQMGQVRVDHVSVIKEVLEDFESRITQWEEYRNLIKARTENNRVKRKLRDELAVVILRRIVPGRCKFCPL